MTDTNKYYDIGLPIEDLNLSSDLFQRMKISTGALDKFTTVQKLGVNPNLTIAGGFQALWNSGGPYTGINPTVAEPVQVFSDNAADTAAGTGARTVLLFGVDGDYNEIIESVTLNGVTPVLTTQSFLRCHLTLVTTAGSGRNNAGKITTRQSVTTANIFSAMPAGFGRSVVAAYTVPLNKRAAVFDIFGSLATKNKGNCTIRIRFRDPLGLDVLAAQFAVLGDGSSFVNFPTNLPRILPEKTDIYMTADTDTNGVGVSGGFTVAVEDLS